MTGSLAKKLAMVLGEIGKVPKSGFNAFHKYEYVTENDLVYAVRDKLSKVGVFVFTSVVSQRTEIIESGDGKKSLITYVETEHTFMDGDSGEAFSVRSQGQGSDNGDKGGYKAITGAMKYFLYKCFMIPTGDDPEADTRTDERHAAGPAAAPVSAPASKPVEVPRTASSTEELRAQFRGGKWETVQIHFGKQKGTPLAKLEADSLTWWISEWQPKEYPAGSGKISQDNLLLRAALDVADEEWK